MILYIYIIIYLHLFRIYLYIKYEECHIVKLYKNEYKVIEFILYIII